MNPMQTAVDGRSARRERNRLAVVEAVLGLMEEGSLNPSVGEITEKSGVSQRSVFRYFDGLEDLRRTVIQHHFSRVEELLDEDGTKDGPLEERIRRFVSTRLKLYEVVANPTRVARTKAPYAPLLAEELSRFRSMLTEQIRSTFASELKAMTSAEAQDVTVLIASIVSFDSWEQMLTVHNRSATQIRRAWTRGLSALLGA
jgi:TetR/AcrR family transcriptional regulator, regulator of autoinduction and epiphytic fitness